MEDRKQKEEQKIKQSNIGSNDRAKSVFYTKMAVITILIVLQVLFMVYVYGRMQHYVIYWRTGALALSAFVVLYLVNKFDNPAYKLAWVIVVMSMPLIGGALYVALAGNRTRKKFIDNALENHLDTFKFMPNDERVQEAIKNKSKSASAQSTYISNYAGYPAYQNSRVEYFSCGEENFDSLLEELSKAEKFIFMEYFIIKQGEMWHDVLKVLKEKVRQGVDVRLIYDDFGCAMWMPSRFINEMNNYGIKVVPFNKLVPIINLRQNNRDHRKITVIDGNVGFTGGINIADEYINRDNKFGHWKDTGVKIVGEAVWSLTLMFLQTWHMLTGESDMYDEYKPNGCVIAADDEFVQPYGDTPVDDEIVGENVYINMITKAKHYIYITTPYLIIDNEMFSALSLAAKSGIDVRIITPGIPDKKLVYMVTQSYYYQLVRAGVKIYQYTPGFIHAKSVVMDDNIATVGTINFDYRSLYLHFECGVWMYGGAAIEDIKKDYLDTLKKCDEVTLEKLVKTSRVKQFLQSMLRVLAPLM